MEIKSFRIRNYRSIKDSGECYLSGDNVTILAGKNESGKTAILEALEDFNTDREIRKEAIPYHEQESKPEISVTFEIDRKTINKISEEINFEIEKTEPIHVKIIKKYPAGYLLSTESKKILKVKEKPVSKKQREKLTGCHERIAYIHATFPQIGGSLPEINLDDIPNFKSQIENFKNVTLLNLVQISDEMIRSDFLQALEEIKNIIIEIDSSNTRSVEKRFIEEIIKYIPNFILFISFEDVFPSEVPLDQAASNELIRDLDIISNLDLGLIMSDSIAFKTKHKEQLNVRVKEDYAKFWTQDLTNLQIEWDSEKLYFLVKEDEDFYPPNLRSKGKQWHLSFYVRVAARAREDVPNVILIDEPGLFLHAKAQKDVLKRLEDSSENAQIIFSTHSPYLIRIDKLNRIRLISRTVSKGSLISNKIHASADKETLTPIITAIGLDLSMGLDIAKDNNVIVEGITDYYYLVAFKEFLRFEFEKEVHFIPSVGADKFGFLVPLMIGWGLNYCVVLDNDDKGRRTEKKLSKDFSHAGIRIIFVSKTQGEQIEELFAREDFIIYVLMEKPEEVPTDKDNSELIRKKDKVLLSKSFLERIKVAGVVLSEETKKKFKNLLEEINKSLFPEG